MPLSAYIVLECCSFAGDSDGTHNRFCTSARYLFCAVAGIYLFRDSFAWVWLYLTEQYVNYKFSYITGKEIFCLLAIAFSCWPRMVDRLFKKEHKVETQNH
jgi:hypothetical protein